MKISFNSVGSKITKEQTKDFGMVAVLVTAFLAFHFKEYNYVKIAFILALLTIVLPVLFYPFALCWFGLSRILGIIGSGILLSIIFLVIVIPIGLIRKLAGYDDLKLKQFKRNEKSVMIDRNHVYDDSDLLNTF
jgi:Saxitoxin biosynthesis operon protein SxtJ